MDGIIEEQLANLPTQPGVYRFTDGTQRLLYVGKAKNLKKRVRSYFTKHHKGARLKALVRKIQKIDFTIVQNEHEALLLENNLIKSEQPKYNVALKDDKTYPYICIKNEEFPRVFFTRKKFKDGSKYFGPYTSVTMARQVLKVITTLFPLRTCKLKLNEENIAAKKFSVCLEYHIGNCLGPCTGLQSKQEYDKNIGEIEMILNGKTQVVLAHLKEQMQKASSELQFEEAEQYRKKIEALAIYREKNRIDNTHLGHADVYHVLEVEGKYFINYMKVYDGAIISCRNIEAKPGLNDSLTEVLERAITEHSPSKRETTR